MAWDRQRADAIVAIFNLDVKFEGQLGSEFLLHYKCIIDFNKRQLITDDKCMNDFETSE